MMDMVFSEGPVLDRQQLPLCQAQVLCRYYIVMAYIVMAYIVMADIVMADIVMAFVVMADIVNAYVVMAIASTVPSPGR